MPVPSYLSLSSKQSGKTRPPRTAVLHLCPDVEPDDPGRETVDLAILTQRNGWRALIASSGGALVPDAERAAVRHWRMPMDGSNIFASWRTRIRLERLFHKEHPALVHAHGIEATGFACVMTRNHNVPSVIDLTQPFDDTPRARRIMEAVKTTPNISVRVPSAFMAQQLIKTYGLNEELINRIAPGVDLQWHGAGFISPERLQNLSHTLRLPDQAAVILVPLPVLPNMGHSIFLQAVAQLTHENVYAILAGSERLAPGERAEIESQVDKLGLGGKIIMPEFCTDLPATCWLSSVVVAPNITPRGQIPEVLAAQAIGRPVIVTNVGASPELVVSGDTAWVIPTNDVHVMADALLEAIQMTTDQRLDLAERTHNFIAENFPQGAWFEGMMGLYDRLLQPAERPSRQAA